MKDQFVQKLNSYMQDSYKGQMYKRIISDFNFENNLHVIPANLLQYICELSL